MHLIRRRKRLLTSTRHSGQVIPSVRDSLPHEPLTAKLIAMDMDQ